MAETAVRQRFRLPEEAPERARVRRRRPLPGGRAVVGGLLVALSAVGIFAGYLGATADESRLYAVARSDLALGHRITAGDLDRARLELPPSVHQLAFARPDALVGGVVLGPVGRGELLQRSDVLVGGEVSAAGREISFPIEAARAVDGQLRTGELIDVLATYGSGADAFTAVIARGARIAGRSDPTGGLAGTGEQVVTLSVADTTTTLAIAHAANAGTLSLVRNLSAPDAVAPDAAVYRTPSGDLRPGPIPAPSAPVPEAVAPPAPPVGP